mmetsp:Transcript_70694/g.197539  ORF Transcript_70694/g.197539 Transcript_70694/m.197539 type:complete len:240 (-) Transcript_70694:774-1493(-)
MISFEEENEDLLGSHKSPYFWEEPDPWYYQLRDVIYEDCVFAYSQTRDTILDFSGDQAYYKLAWYLRYNPVYWAAFAVCSTSLFVGKRAHDFLHQGERVRLDETEAEHDARIMWIYPTDGVACMLAMMDLALIAYMGDGGVFQSATGTDDLLSLVVRYVTLRCVALRVPSLSPHCPCLPPSVSRATRPHHLSISSSPPSALSPPLYLTPPHHPTTSCNYPRRTRSRRLFSLRTAASTRR